MSLPRPSRETAAAPPADAPVSDSEPPQRLTVGIVREAGDWTLFDPIDPAVDAIAAALAAHPRIRAAALKEATIALSSDERVRALNLAYRGQDKPTNVLSFPSGDPDDGYLGDIILAQETVAREAAAQAIPPSHHLQHLVLHGLLHLLGYDHETDAEAAVMEGLETEILATLGIADPYAEPGPAAAPDDGERT
jgi:probable rRNA maturation factor